MRKVILALVIPIMFLSCSKDANEITAENNASFKVEYIQTGKFEGYSRTIGIKPNLIFEGTDISTGAVLDDSKLTNEKYTLVTKGKIELLKLTFKLVPKQGVNDLAEFTINVYKNGKKIDNKSFKVQSSSLVMDHSWEYKAK